MNQRLRELMIEAGYAAPEIAPRAQKLAELIIRECAHVGFQTAYPKCGVDVLTNIKKHFGLEK